MTKTIKDIDGVITKYIKSIPTDEEIKKQEDEWIKNNTIVPYEHCLIYVPLFISRDFTKEIRTYLDKHPEYDRINDMGKKHSAIGVLVRELLEKKIREE